MFDIEQYLARIGYSGPRSVTSETLRNLHRLHMLNVPFENLDIHLKRSIILDENRLFEKIIGQHRGGFCYELNGLFALLLRSLGFDVQLLSARVYDSAGNPGPEFDHLTLLVKTENAWIADVGFGDSFLEPLLLESPDDQNQHGEIFRLHLLSDGPYCISRKQNDSWSSQYQFTLQPHQLADFSAQCVWQQTSPDSHFVQKKICSMARVNGRITLSDMKLIVTKGKTRDEFLLNSADEYEATLRKYFGFTVQSISQD